MTVKQLLDKLNKLVRSGETELEDMVITGEALDEVTEVLQDGYQLYIG